MKAIFVVITFCLYSIAGAEIVVTNSDGGSVVTDLGMGVQVNKGSTLHRKFIMLNATNCPLGLDGVGVTTSYNESEHEYNFRAVGTLHVSQSCQAYEMRLMLFDVFGEHMRTLSDEQVSDWDSGNYVRLADEVGGWYAPETDVQEYLTCVAFVAHARGTNGAVWSFDEKSIVDQLRRLNLKSEGVIEPTKEPPKK